jgi:hypothetical protein
MLKYDCNRLITSADEKPELFINKENEIDITADQEITYKIKIHNLASPLKFIIKF